MVTFLSRSRLGWARLASTFTSRSAMFFSSSQPASMPPAWPLWHRTARNWKDLSRNTHCSLAFTLAAVTIAEPSSRCDMAFYDFNFDLNLPQGDRHRGRIQLHALLGLWAHL